MRSTSLLHCVIKTLAIVALICTGASISAQTIIAITPAVGQEGDLFVIDGSGFGGVAANHSVLINDGTRSVLAEVMSASPTQLTCRLLVVADAMTGDIEVRVGTRTFLPRSALDSGPHTVWVDGVQWFQASSTTEQPNYTATPSSPGSVAAIRSQGEILIDLEPVEPQIEHGVAVVRIDIETGAGQKGGGQGQGDPSSGSDDEQMKSANQPPVLEVRLAMELQSQAAITAAELASAVAKALRQNFGSRGLNAIAAGKKIRISHTSWTTTTETYGHLQLVPDSASTNP